MAESLQISAALCHRTTGLGRSNPGFEARALRLSLPENRPYQNISTSLSSVTRYNDFRLAALVVYELGSRAKQGKQSNRQKIAAEASDSLAESIQKIVQSIFKFLAKTPFRAFLLGLDKVLDKTEDALEDGVDVVKAIDAALDKVEEIAEKVEEIAEEVEEDLDDALGVNHDHDKARDSSTSSQKSTS